MVSKKRDIHTNLEACKSKHTCLSYKKMSQACDPIYLTTGHSGISQQHEKKQQRQMSGWNVTRKKKER